MTLLELFLSSILLFLSIAYFNLLKHNRILLNELNKLRNSFESLRTGVHNIYMSLSFSLFEESKDSYKIFVQDKMLELYNLISRK